MKYTVLVKYSLGGKYTVLTKNIRSSTEIERSFAENIRSGAENIRPRTRNIRSSSKTIRFIGLKIHVYGLKGVQNIILFSYDPFNKVDYKVLIEINEA